VKIQSVVLREVADKQTNKQTDKQTNAGYYITSLTEVIKQTKTYTQNRFSQMRHDSRKNTIASAL